MHSDIVQAAERYRKSHKAEDALAVARKAREYHEWIECQSWYRTYLCAVPGDPEVIAEMGQVTALQIHSSEASKVIDWVRYLGRQLNWPYNRLISPIEELQQSVLSGSGELVKKRIEALKKSFLDELCGHFAVKKGVSPWLAFLDWAETEGDYDLAEDLLQYHRVPQERAEAIRELNDAVRLLESFRPLFRGNSDEPWQQLKSAVEQRNLPEVRRLTELLLQRDEPDEDGGSAGLPARRPPPRPTGRLQDHHKPTIWPEPS